MPTWAHSQNTGDRSVDGVIFVKLDTGGVMIAAGQIHYGVRGVAGEIGHLSIDPDGPHVCGQRGCLVKFVGADALKQAAVESGLVDEGPDTLQRLARLVHGGDSDAWQLAEDVLEHLVTGLTSLVNVIAPRIIFLSGPLMDFGERFINELQSHPRS